MHRHAPSRPSYGASLHPKHSPRSAPISAFSPDLEPGVVAAYGTLGASALGFVGTFAVAPRYRENFKETLDWREIYAALVAQGGVRTVTAEDAYKQTSSGCGGSVVDLAVTVLTGKRCCWMCGWLASMRRGTLQAPSTYVVVACTPVF